MGLMSGCLVPCIMSLLEFTTKIHRKERRKKKEKEKQQLICLAYDKNEHMWDAKTIRYQCLMLTQHFFRLCFKILNS